MIVLILVLLLVLLYGGYALNLLGAALPLILIVAIVVALLDGRRR